MNNRLTDEERLVFEKLRQWLNHMSPENFRHMVRAARAWWRSELEKERASA